MGEAVSIRDIVGGLATSALVAAVVGRLAYHTRMVQQGERKFWSREMLLEIPIVVFTYVLGIGVADYFGFRGTTAGAVVAVISYFGPGAIQWAAETYLSALSKGVSRK